MSEAIAFPVEVPEEISETAVAEKSANTKTKIITAAGLAAAGLAGWYAESRGMAGGWPPPAHSFKHPWLGYYSAWGMSKVRGMKGNSAALTAGAFTDIAAESLQDVHNSSDHHPFHWLGQHNRNSDSDLDNIVDFACCMGGTAIFLAQNNGLSWAKAKFVRLRASQA